jgi:hypothetical protein
MGREEKETVIVSCMPRLNTEQEKGMLQLLQDIEQGGRKVYFWCTETYKSLQPYTTLPSHLPKGYYYYYKTRSQLLLNKNNWLPQLKRWCRVNTKAAAAHEFHQRRKEALKLFARLRPSLFICWNPNCVHRGIATAVARQMGIRTGAIEWGFLPGTFILDRTGTLASSEIFNRALVLDEQQRKNCLDTGAQIFEELRAGSLSLYAQKTSALPDELMHPSPGTIKVLLLGIDELDSGCYPPENPARRGLLPFHRSSFEQAKAIAGANPAFRVIYKPHPTHNLHATDRQETANCWVINTNPDQLIDWSDVVVCSGSKMEFSALMKQKPLVNVGAGLLYKKGCSYKADRADLVEKAIVRASQAGVTAEQINTFKIVLGYLKLYYLYSYAGTAADRMAIVQRVLEDRRL